MIRICRWLSAAYDSDDQATSFAPLSGSGASETVGYQDQGNGLRSSLTTSAGSTSFDNGPLGVTASTTSAGTTYYTRDPQGNLIDERGPGGTFYYLTDRNNSVIALIDSSGNDAGDYHYDPYGALTNSGSLSTAAAANPWRYDGGYQDSVGDDDYHFGARYYDPTIDRFTQPDTVTGNQANPHTLNLYTYAGSDPINNTDPTGHSIVGDIAGTLDVVGGLVGGTIGIGIGIATGDPLAFGLGIAALAGAGAGAFALGSENNYGGV